MGISLGFMLALILATLVGGGFMIWFDRTMVRRYSEINKQDRWKQWRNSTDARDIADDITLHLDSLKSKSPKEPGALVISLEPKNDQSCPLCWEKVDSYVWYCSDCKTLYHMDCLDEMAKGRCPTTGCDNGVFEQRRIRA